MSGNIPFRSQSWSLLLVTTLQVFSSVLLILSRGRGSAWQANLAENCDVSTAWATTWTHSTLKQEDDSDKLRPSYTNREVNTLEDIEEYKNLWPTLWMGGTKVNLLTPIPCDLWGYDSASRFGGGELLTADLLMLLHACDTGRLLLVSTTSEPRDEWGMKCLCLDCTVIW